MRALILAIAVVLALPSAAAAQRDWARAYDEGKEAFKKENWALAEQKMLEAKEGKGAPKQARRANFSSILFQPFIPDYYLGVIAARQGQYQKAERYLQSAIDQKLVVEGDRTEYALATSTLVRARDEQAKLAAAKATPPPPLPIEKPIVTPVPPNNSGTGPTNPTQQPSTGPSQPNTGGTGTQTPTNVTTTPTPIRTTPTTPVEQPWMADFRRSMDAGRASLGQSRYAEAFSSAAGAMRVAGDNPSRQQADQLRREIERQQGAAAQRLANQAREAVRTKNIDGALTLVASLEYLDANHAALKDIRDGIDALRKLGDRAQRLATAERSAVRMFLSGNYKQAEAELQRAVTDGLTSPRIYLFLASSHAAQALLAKESERPALVDEARKAYAQARPNVGSLSADRRFISPSILRLIGAS